MSAKMNINRDDLYRLYIIERKPSRTIAKEYRCAYSTIDNWIHRYEFPTRSLAQAHIKTFRRAFEGNVQEKSYLLGFRIGDLRVRKFYKNSETIKIDCGSTRRDQIDHIKKLFSPYGHIWIGKPTFENKIQIECAVDDSFDFLLKKYRKFPKYTMMDQNCFLSILAGFIDAEGCFMVSKDNKRSVFSIGNYETRILKQIKVFLDESSIHNRLRLGVRKGYQGKDGYVHNKDYWILSVCRKNDLYRFTERILPFLKYSRKISDAKRVLNNIEYRNLLYGT